MQHHIAKIYNLPRSWWSVTNVYTCFKFLMLYNVRIMHLKMNSHALLVPQRCVKDSVPLSGKWLSEGPSRYPCHTVWLRLMWTWLEALLHRPFTATPIKSIATISDLKLKQGLSNSGVDARKVILCSIQIIWWSFTRHLIIIWHTLLLDCLSLTNLCFAY